MAKLAPKELSAILDAEKKDSLSAEHSSKLTEERERAMNYYLGDMDADMPPMPDRSKAVSMDVFDTVEGLMPGLMEIFTGGEEVVTFEAQGPEDMELAEQETDYVNYVFQRLNPGYTILYSMIKDALLQKTGLVKVWWDSRVTEEEEVYNDIDEAALGLLTEDSEIEIVAISEREPVQMPGSPMDQQPVSPPPPAAEGGMPPMGAEGSQPPMAAEGMPPPNPMGQQPLPPQPIMDKRFDVTVMRRQETGYAHVEPVPPEEFGISRRSKSIEDCDYCYHEVRRTIGDMITMGYDADQLMSLGPVSPDDSTEALARDTVDESSQQGSSSNMNKMTREVVVTEHYCLIDYEGDNKPCLYKVVTGGEGTTQILERKGEPHIEKIDAVPFAAMTPYIQPHRFIGRSMADAVIDIQRIKTSVTRALLDNMYLANNQRIEIAEAMAGDNTIDDLLTNRPGGIVRTKAPGGLLPIPNQPIGNFGYPLIEYYDAEREWRTGVTKQGMGLDPNALQNVGENAILDAANSARQKQKLIARTFAETGITSLFKLLHKTIRRNDTKANTVRLRNKWVTVHPREWKTRQNLICHVGLGTGSTQQQLGFLTQLLQIQREAITMPQLKLVDAKKIYNTLERLVEKAGFRSVEMFFTDPDVGPPVPAPPDPAIELEKMKLQGQMQMQDKQMQLEGQKMQGEFMFKSQELQQKTRLEEKQAEADIVSDNRKTENEMMLKRMEFELKRELAIIEANLKAAEQNRKLVTDISTELIKQDGSEGDEESQEAPYSRIVRRLEAQSQQIETMLADVQARLQAAEDAAVNVGAGANQMAQSVEEIKAQVASPKMVQRDENGRVIGIIGAGGVVQQVVRDPQTGAIAGVQ